MPMLERVRGERAIIGSFFHELGERAAVTEWWPDPSIVFTSHGVWEVGARRGRGEVTPDTVLVNEPAAEHDCLHPHGLDDRMLCVMFREDVDPGPALLVPHVPALHSLRRSLVAELRSATPDSAETDALALAMLQAVWDVPATSGAAPRPGERSRALVQRLRAKANAGYRDPGLDLVAQARALGLSRTRFVHVFRDVTGVTPHRYVIELRTGHAARLLRGTGASAAGQLYAVAAMYGLLKMVSLAGFPSLIPALVPESRLDQANALEGVTYGLASLAGAGLAGLAVATVGAPRVVAFDAVSYLVMALSLWSVRDLSEPAGRSARAAPRGPGIGAVLRLAVASPVLRDTTIMFALFNVGEGALLVFLPHRALRLGLGPGGYGYLVAASTAGELLAALLLTRMTWRAPLTTSIVTAQIAAALLVVPLVVRSAAVTVAALAALGLCAAPMTAWAQSLRMRLVPPQAHGRLFALLRTSMQATPPAGAALAALVIGRGAVITVTAIAATMGIPALVLARDLLRAPGAGREPAPAGTSKLTCP